MYCPHTKWARPGTLWLPRPAQVVAFYVEQSRANNHSVREAACACMAELMAKVGTVHGHGAAAALFLPGSAFPSWPPVHGSVRLARCLLQSPQMRPANNCLSLHSAHAAPPINALPPVALSLPHRTTPPGGPCRGGAACAAPAARAAELLPRPGLAGARHGLHRLRTLRAGVPRGMPGGEGRGRLSSVMKRKGAILSRGLVPHALSHAVTVAARAGEPISAPVAGLSFNKQPLPPARPPGPSLPPLPLPPLPPPLWPPAALGHSARRAN